MPTDPPNSPPPLAYERPSGVTRGAFRLLLLLTLINTILLGTSLMGPQTWQAVRGAYTGFKERRAGAAAAAQRRAALQAAATFAFPDGHVTYTEAPDEAMRLVLQGLRYEPILAENSNTPPPNWQAPVGAYLPPALATHAPLGTPGVLFVHERTSPNGTTMLVLVAMRATYAFENQIFILDRDTVEETTYRLSKRRRLQSVALTTGSNGDPKTERQYELELILPDHQLTEVGTDRRPRYARAPATVPVIKPGNQLRFFGGSPDAADASHFTIPFELDGQAGIIDGWLRDDALVLTPRQGRVLPTAQHPAWDLLPATQPALLPTAKP
jgi:hypothetical protein